MFTSPSPLAAQCPGQRGAGSAGALVCPGTATSWREGLYSPDHIGVNHSLRFGSSQDPLLCPSPILPGAAHMQDQTHAAARGCCRDESMPLHSIPQCWMSAGAKVPLAAQVQHAFLMLRPSLPQSLALGAFPLLK